MEKRYVEELRNIENAAQSELNLIHSEISTDSLTTIKASKKEILAFIKQFIESEITEPVLKQKMLNNLNDNVFNFKVTLGKDSGGINRPTVDKKGKPYVYREAWLGAWQIGGKIKTNLYAIRGIIHELAHSVSQKFDIERLKKFENPHEKDQSIGEIESKFIEQIFDQYLISNAEKLGNKNILGLTSEQIKQDIQYLQEYDLKDLIQKTRCSRDVSRTEKDRNYDKRYVIGGVVSRILENEYKSNREQIINLFSQYLSQNADMDIDEAVRFLTSGKYQNYPEIIDMFIKQRELSVKKVEESDLVDYKQSKVSTQIIKTKSQQKENEKLIEVEKSN